MSAFNENTVELAALEYFAELGYRTLHGPDIAPGEPGAERDSYGEVFLWGRLREAIRRINPGTSPALIDEALKRVRRAESQSPIDENYRLHQLITEGVPVEHRDADGDARNHREDDGAIGEQAQRDERLADAALDGDGRGAHDDAQGDQRGGLP